MGRRIGAGGGSDEGGGGGLLVAIVAAVALGAGGTTVAAGAGARDLHRLVDGSGTGNVTEPSRERGRYRSVRYTGDVHASDRDGTAVVNAQAEPVARRASESALTTLVTEAIR